ncbi:MAG: hypothetical protein WCA27_31830 [Candidatus Sulfotelmatobacter sp.]
MSHVFEENGRSDSRRRFPCGKTGVSGFMGVSAVTRNNPIKGAAALAYIQQMRDNNRTGLNPKTTGFTAIGVFLFFAAIMASLAGTTLLWQGTALGRIWVLNPTAYKQLAPLGGIVGIFFLVLGTALLTAGIGWFRRRLWAWRLAVVIVATQVVGDVVNCVRGDWLRGGTGVIIAGALLLFLLQPRIRAAFA